MDTSVLSAAQEHVVYTTAGAAGVNDIDSDVTAFVYVLLLDNGTCHCSLHEQKLLSAEATVLYVFTGVQYG